ncbi:MAG: RNA 2',3'-cyclic phosphodiesterase [Thermoanaerobaculum sp.]|nr:RNA 2',3'-cyclic phosphodiesterase [Thermoanaerobaculum sp.]
MRCFLAVELPRPLRDSLATAISRLQGQLPPARWVKAEGLHITLKFLGEQGEREVAALVSHLERGLKGVVFPVTVSLQGGGFFPHSSRPRVAWIGGAAPGLESWAAAAEEAAQAIGVPRESRPFSLHVTLARLERSWPAAACERFLSELSSLALPPFPAREVVLFSSTLRPGGAVYTPQLRLPVGGR